MTQFIENLINGLSLGSYYALIALGYTMVYGILKFINFAHANIFMLGAWFSWMIATQFGWTDADSISPIISIPVVMIGSMLLCGVLGVVIEKLAYSPLRNADRLNILITAIGVSLLLENAAQLDKLFGTQPERMPVLFNNTTVLEMFGAQLLMVDLIGITLAIILMLILNYLIFHTKLGSAMRAVSFSHQNASLMGISPNYIIALTFFIGSTLAAAAGFLYSTKYVTLSAPGTEGWVLLGIKAFVAAVVGGIGNIKGAVVGGVLIGVLEIFGASYLSSQYRDLYVFVVLIVVLLVKPTGIFGKPEREKV